MHKTFSIFESLNFGWNEFRHNWKFWLVVFLIVFGTNSVSGGPGNDSSSDTKKKVTQNFNYESNVLGTSTQKDLAAVPSDTYSNISAKPADSNMLNVFKPYQFILIPYAAITAILILGLLIVLWAVKIGIQMGGVRVQLEAIRIGSHNYTTLLSNFSVKRAIRYGVLQISYVLLVFVGLIFFIIPGIYFALKYMFASIVFVDKDISIGEAFSTSGKLTKGNKFKLMGFGIISFILCIFSLLFFLVGVFVAVIVLSLALSYIYVTLSKEDKATEAVPTLLASS
jgi:hypothetical protein